MTVFTGTLLPLLLVLQGVCTQASMCPCDKEDFKDTLEGVHSLHDVFVSSRHRSIHCCKRGLLDEPGDFNEITWTYNGQPYPWHSKGNSSLEMEHHCPETLETNSAKMSDAGNYTCTITTVNKTMVNRTYIVRVLESDEYRQKPILSHLSPDVLTLPGENVTLTCRGFFGRKPFLGRFGGNIVWRRVYENDTLDFVENQPNTNLRVTWENNGMVTNKLHLTEVRRSDYGRYTCILKNSYDEVSYNVSIIYGLPVHEQQAVTLRAWLLVVVFVSTFLATTLCVWCRCRTILQLYYKENFAPLPPKAGDYRWDVMVVHGDDAAGWVWRSFVPRLEETHGYSCFLPERDLCGGQMVAETVAEIVGQCGRVVVVVTKGLLESPMAVWALHQSVHAVLTTKAKMIAVVIEDITKMKVSSKDGLVAMLKVVRKLRWPGPWNPEENVDDEAEEVFEEVSMTDKEKVKEKKSKGNSKKKTKKMKNNNNSEKNINNQKVSNMVSAYNKENLDALEDLDKVMKKEMPPRPTRLYINLNDHASTSEPDSPDSQAPFIMPSVSCGIKSKVGCWDLIRIGCTLDPVELFWQKLRLHLLTPIGARDVQGSQQPSKITV